MKKEWKSNNYNNVRQIVEAHTHMSAEEFLYPQKDPYLHGLKEAVQFVKLKLRHKVPVHIVGDYDVDGEMSTAILELALETFGGYPVHVRLPRRFSEGYGLSMKIIDEISDGLIITVDHMLLMELEIQNRYSEWTILRAPRLPVNFTRI